MKFPECGNTIELDWHEDEECCEHHCGGHCGECEEAEDDKELDDYEDIEEEDDDEDDM